jgi:hypothetical protein
MNQSGKDLETEFLFDLINAFVSSFNAKKNNRTATCIRAKKVGSLRQMANLPEFSALIVDIFA